MRQILLFAALSTSLALLSGCTLSKTKADTAEDMTGKAAYHKISAEEAYEMMASQEVVVVDVRTREEYDGGHIENAVLVPNESIGSEMPEALPTKGSHAAGLLPQRPPQQGCRTKAAGAGVSERLRLRRRHRLALRACEGGMKGGQFFNLAVHALVCLSHSGRSLSSEALAENICTNPTRVRRVLAGLKKGGNGGDPGGLGRRLPPDGRPGEPFPPAGGGGGEYPLCGLRVAQRRH